MKKYKLGAMYNSNFDYTGMLQAGLKTKSTDSLNRLTKLFDSFEDVNYHKASSPLWGAILKRRNNPNANIDIEINEFKKLVQIEISQE
jgi:hypothetical protein